MSPREILFGKKFKTPLCKIGYLVMAYNVTANNKTTMVFFALYIGPNDSKTGHQVFKLLLRQSITTPKYKPVHMPDYVIQVVNDMCDMMVCQMRSNFVIHIMNQLSHIY